MLYIYVNNSVIILKRKPAQNQQQLLDRLFRIKQKDYCSPYFISA